jgi:6-bladed beta-propeller protein
MQIARPSPVAVLLGLALAACGRADSARLARAVTDTLPGGIVRVMSAGPTAWADSTGARLVEEGRFRGEDGTPGELADPGSIAVDDAGRIYVADKKPASIKMFTSEGKLVRVIGRDGEGPGEFRAGFLAVRGAHLVLHDPELGRTSVWDTSGTFLRSWRSSCCYWSDIQIDRQDHIYVPSVVPDPPGARPRGTPYVRWTIEGVAVDTLRVPVQEGQKAWTVTVGQGTKNMMSMMTEVPLTPVIVSALHPNGGIVYGRTGEYRVVRSATGRDSARVFGRAWTPEPVTNEQRRVVVEEKIKEVGNGFGVEALRAAFHLEDVPRTLPAFENLRVDQSDRVWARRYAVGDTTRTHYDVFDSTGGYLGPVTAPVNVFSWGKQAWTRDGFVAIIEDAEGRPTVVRFKLVLQGRQK